MAGAARASGAEAGRPETASDRQGLVSVSFHGPASGAEAGRPKAVEPSHATQPRAVGAASRSIRPLKGSSSSVSPTPPPASSCNRPETDRQPAESSWVASVLRRVLQSLMFPTVTVAMVGNDVSKSGCRREQVMPA